MAKEQNQNNELPAVREELDIFKKFDQLDDEIILSELENRVTDVWVYHFVVSGKHVWGVSKEGVDQCVERMAKQGMALRDNEIDYRVDPTNPEYVLFSAKVERVLCDKDGREVRVDSAIGTKRQRTMIVLKNQGKLVENQFWFEQGSQKALRNARLRLIPEDIKAKVITYAKQKKKVRKIESSKEEEKKSQEKKKRESASYPQSIMKEKVESGQMETHKEFGFPGEEEEKEQTIDVLTQEQKMNVVRLEATLVDKYGYSPDSIIDQLEKRFDVTDINKATPDQANDVIRFLESTIDWANRKMKAEGKTQ